ncbi:hypothetical protein Ancab_032927 [Ancistrocladus abbreviatus]
MVGVREIQIAGRKLVIHELDDLYDSLTGRVLTGSWVWNSAFLLADYISTQSQHHEFNVQGKIVLELGAGSTGLPGLTASLLGASRVILTDIAMLLPGLRHNVEANGLGDRIEVCELVWGSDELPNQLSELKRVDWVLMSDVFYDQLETTALAKTVKRVCGSETRVWAASEVRPWTSECLNELLNEGFSVAELLSKPVTTSVSSGSSVMEDSSNSELFSVFELIPPKEDNVVYMREEKK